MVTKINHDDSGIEVLVDGAEDGDAVIQAFSIARKCYPQSVRPRMTFDGEALLSVPTKMAPLPEHTKKAAAVLRALLEVDGYTCDVKRVEDTETRIKTIREK